MVSETNKIVEETTVLSGSGFPVDPVLRILWRGIPRGACCYDDDGTTICDDTLSQSECNALDGNFTRNVKCVDDPCTGACCEDDGMGGFTCEDLTATDCDSVGGDFKGIDTACSDDPDPCASPCPTDVTLVCDQVCIEGAKCGWSGTFNSGAPTDTYWQTATAETATHFDRRDEVGNGTICDADAHTTVTGNHPVTFTGEFCDPSDGTQVACSGTSVCSCYDTVCDGECSTDDDCSGGFCSAGICCTNGVPVGTETCDFCSSVCDNSSCFGNANVNPAFTFQVGNAVADNEWSFDAGFTPVFPDTSGSTTFSGEIFTSTLISTMVAALPSYDDDFNDTCEAKRIDLDGDNRHFNICRFKPKFTFSSAALNFTINYNEHFVPQGGGSATDTPKNVMVSIGDTEAIGDEVVEPGANGTVTITDIEVTC